MQQTLRRIVIIGPESTGKSTLCQHLAAHYSTKWCAEYAREYLIENGTDYTFANLLDIAKRQAALEDKTADLANHFLFVDTDLLVMKVWCEFVFNQCHTWILNEIVNRPADLYLLCNIDLPWVKDDLREYPDEKPRQQLYHIYRDMLINQNTPWVSISGHYEERLQTAIQAVDNMIKSANSIENF